MTASTGPAHESLTAIVRRFAALAIELAILHVQSAKNELAASANQVKGAAVILAVAAGLIVMGLVILVFTLVLGLAALTGFPGWAMGLFLMIVFLGVAGLLAWIGIRRLSSVNFVPEKTIASLTEELEWLQKSIGRR